MNKAVPALCCAFALAFCAPAGWADSGHQHSAHAHGHTSTQEQMPWGIAGEPGAVTRTIVISMTDDMRFRPDTLNVRLGETVKFELRNDGKVLHEFVLGTVETHEALYAQILKTPDMHHEAPYMIHVDPGQIGTVVWRFNRLGSFEFACLLPGHYPAGMRGVINVSEP